MQTEWCYIMPCRYTNQIHKAPRPQNKALKWNDKAEMVEKNSHSWKVPLSEKSMFQTIYIYLTYLESPLIACTSMCHCFIQELSTLHSTCTTDTQLAIHSTSSYIDNLTIIFFHLLFLLKKLKIFLPFNGEPIHKITLSISLSTVISA